MSLRARRFLVFLFVCGGITGCMAPGTSSLVPIDSTGSQPITGSPGSPVALDSEEAAFVVLINNYRAASGLTQLKVSLALTTSSKWMSTDMANLNYFTHTDSLGRDPFTRMAFFGYDTSGYSGENIAAGYATAQETFTQWKNSPAHNANMLDGAYKVFGVARASNPSSSYNWYWTTDFGSVVDVLLQ